MLQKNKRNICYNSVPVAPPESISKHCLWWFEVVTLTAKQLTIFIFYLFLLLLCFFLNFSFICYFLFVVCLWCGVM